MTPRATRLIDRPIIAPHMDGRMGANINGPSLIRAPDWLPGRLGAYYLYFAHHLGRYIRLAYADDLTGPWRMYEPGVLDVADSFFPARDELVPSGYCAHIASPDVHVDSKARTIRMFFHGLLEDGKQGTRLALSADGLSFAAEEVLLGPPYFRVFLHDGFFYTVVWGGELWRSTRWGAPFEKGPTLVPVEVGDGPARTFRHGAVHVDGDTLHLFYSRIGDKPERILHTTVDLRGDWITWRTTHVSSLLEPALPWEGADLPLEYSLIGDAQEPVRQVRDPCIFVDDDGRTYLLYSCAGESGIAIAELRLEKKRGECAVVPTPMSESVTRWLHELGLGQFAELFAEQHKRCAEFFSGSDSTLYAEHLGHADDPGAAEAFLGAAKEQAEQYRFERALTLTDRGLGVVREADIRHRLRCLKGELLHELDEPESSVAVFEVALEEATDDLQLCDAWMGLAAGKRVTDDFDGALALLENAEPVAIRHNLGEQLSRLHHLRGNLFYTTGNIDGCREEHLLALDFAREADSLEDQARALGGIADAEYARGRMRSARDAFQRWYALSLEEYTSAEPMPWSDFFIARARALARVGRGEHSEALAHELMNLLGQANDMGYMASVPILEDALARQY